MTDELDGLYVDYWFQISAVSTKNMSVVERTIVRKCSLKIQRNITVVEKLKANTIL